MFMLSCILSLRPLYVNIILASNHGLSKGEKSYFPIGSNHGLPIINQTHPKNGFCTQLNWSADPSRVYVSGHLKILKVSAMILY